MYLIIFIVLTLLIALIYYKANQCSGMVDFLGSLFISICIQIVICGVLILMYQLYMLKPL